ncbi:unnamed protein product [Rotaria magnacalcarata]|uniref:Uncharacterized protein n=4 Tax=Rotaria magnacalcarata TaxID=392030 RepID=A0A814FYE1_9BILA|nr:unnamed protein product [Rotaria magnacalcarata]CAF2149801.1 unnamed protein product [Rotaria magnacalcarata]CAF5127226.1 unnamed protein product [Rotaria magnacalcarata]
MVDLKRTIIILMAVATIVNVVGVIHCHINHPYLTTWYGYQMGYSVIFPVLLALTGFLFLEQLLITDGTIAPLNRLRILYAFIAAAALLVFGISTAIVASGKYNSYAHDHYYRNAVLAALIAFIDAAVYISEAIARNRKSRII